MKRSIKELEIIVVNDCSTDGTGELLDYFAAGDKRIRAIHLKENGGRSNARNHGNGLAASPYIFVLDADDRSCKDRVRDTLLAFEMKKPDIVYGPFYTMDSLGNVEGKVPAGPFNEAIARKRKFNFIGHSTMAYRTGLTKNIHYDTGEFSRLGLDDWKFQWDAYLKGYKFAVTRTFLSYWRMHEDGVSQTRNMDEVIKTKDQYLATV